MEEIRALAPYYVSEQDVSGDKGGGVALLKIFANMLKLVIDRLNSVPEKNFVAFLDMLGIKLLPAQPARAAVTFYLSEGAPENVLIPERSQISAEEIVFETEKNIVATPSKLAKVYGISVDKDGIFASPANIVKGEVAFPFYSTLIFSAAKGDRKLVLREVTGLEKGDVLKVEKTKGIEYVEVSEVSDTRVSIKDKLVHTHNVGTSVEKVTDFELFDGLNLQQHILYLGHEDLFNITGEATITVRVTDSQSASKLGDSNIVQWEYWGEAIRTEGTKEIKEIDWHPLNIVLPEAEIFQEFQLQKKQRGEIKECEINVVKSRWIRCKTPNIAKTKDIVLGIIQIGGEGSVQRVSQFYTLPPKAIRGVGTEFAKRLTESGVNTIEELLKFKDKVDDLAQILSGAEEPSRYKERAENILENAEKRIMDKEYEDMVDVDIVIQGILPDMAFYNDVPLDLTPGDGQEFKTPIYPFGKIPRLYDTFYIASQECFSKRNTEIDMKFYLLKCGEPGDAGITLSWEYWNGNGWNVIKNLADDTNKFTVSEKNVKFTCPEDVKPTPVNGQENYWIRVKIVDGDYGKEKFEDVSGTWKPDTSQIKPPVIKKLTITYAPSSQNLQHCLTYNNLEFKDVTEESKTENKTFNPFQPLDDEHQTLYLGFDKRIEKGPISIFFSLEEQKLLIEEMQKIGWFYYSQEKKRVRLEVLDNTRNLTRTETVEFVIPTDFAKTSKFGDERYWLKAVDIEDKIRYLFSWDSVPGDDNENLIRFLRDDLDIGWVENAKIRKSEDGKTIRISKDEHSAEIMLDEKEGKATIEISDGRTHDLKAKKENGKLNIYNQSPKVKGIYLNTAFAIQAESIEDEILGSSDGTADQKYQFTRIPVITEEIWVNEIGTLLEEEKKTIMEKMGKDSVLEKKDETGKTTEVRVRWQAVEDFLDSRPKSRHYVVDRATGEVKFGDGVCGMVPPIGRSNIKATYQVGGGVKGNVRAAEISTLKTAIPFVDSVTNPVDAGGGADIEPLEATMKRGPWVVKHGNRAVTVEDFEWLARQASRNVARVKCLADTNESGRVTVIIVPESEEDKPTPSLELKKLVEKYLLEHSSNVVSLQVEEPEYIEVSVSVDVFPASIDVAPLAEKEALKRLKEFLHPLTGGEDGKGWEFGRLAYLSDIYALLEGITEIDHVENLRVTMTPEKRIPNALICSGEHRISIKYKGAI